MDEIATGKHILHSKLPVFCKHAARIILNKKMKTQLKNLRIYPTYVLKGTQAWDNFWIFLDLNQILICPSQIFEKNFASFPSIFARISMFEHFRGDWAYAEPNFFWEISKKFFLKIFTLVLLDRFLDVFSKFWFFIGEICILIRDFWVIFENYSMRMLSIHGNNFIAYWAYAEPISLHAEHTRNEFPRMLSQR